MGAGKSKKRRGHDCWSCERYLPNERFSGRGHSRHLCKECSRLGREELEVRQAVRDIDRCLDRNGRLRRKQRVRHYIEELEERWAEER